MKTSDFYYDLPQELIAQTPLDRRDASRLLTLNKETGETEHHHFYELPQFLRPGDCLVLNNSRVLPARLIGHRPHRRRPWRFCCWWIRAAMSGSAWCARARSSGQGARVSFGDGQLHGGDSGGAARGQPAGAL